MADVWGRGASSMGLPTWLGGPAPMHPVPLALATWQLLEPHSIGCWSTMTEEGGKGSPRCPKTTSWGVVPWSDLRTTVDLAKI